MADTKCAGCGKTDSTPKINTGYYTWVKSRDAAGEPSEVVNHPNFHFDCVPPEIEEWLGTPKTHPQHTNTLATIAVARDGVHDGELAKFIARQKKSDNDLEEVPSNG